ncbi:hypothetical protein HYFRA_00003637 [Hymenoscyphus fraxineus]|uniref:Uncharacterized protein n=1 Tax=Hymenoscyphus fraxineus TaxID=746836 RepID=A0A9N9PW60_9HELO|nr:hypothetical protein HYFRA_00003637 [Hymenoscyphus fraxineus]
MASHSKVSRAGSVTEGNINLHSSSSSDTSVEPFPPFDPSVGTYNEFEPQVFSSLYGSNLNDHAAVFEREPQIYESQVVALPGPAAPRQQPQFGQPVDFNNNHYTGTHGGTGFVPTVIQTPFANATHPMNFERTTGRPLDAPVVFQNHHYTGPQRGTGFVPTVNFTPFADAPHPVNTHTTFGPALGPPAVLGNHHYTGPNRGTGFVPTVNFTPLADARPPVDTFRTFGRPVSEAVNSPSRLNPATPAFVPRALQNPGAHFNHPRPVNNISLSNMTPNSTPAPNSSHASHVHYPNHNLDQRGHPYTHYGPVVNPAHNSGHHAGPAPNYGPVANPNRNFAQNAGLPSGYRRAMHPNDAFSHLNDQFAGPSSGYPLVMNPNDNFNHPNDRFAGPSSGYPLGMNPNDNFNYNVGQSAGPSSNYYPVVNPNDNFNNNVDNFGGPSGYVANSNLNSGQLAGPSSSHGPVANPHQNFNHNVGQFGNTASNPGPLLNPNHNSGNPANTASSSAPPTNFNSSHGPVVRLAMVPNPFDVLASSSRSSGNDEFRFREMVPTAPRAMRLKRCDNCQYMHREMDRCHGEPRRIGNHSMSLVPSVPPQVRSYLTRKDKKLKDIVITHDGIYYNAIRIEEIHFPNGKVDRKEFNEFDPENGYDFLEALAKMTESERAQFFQDKYAEIVIDGPYLNAMEDTPEGIADYFKENDKMDTLAAAKFFASLAADPTGNAKGKGKEIEPVTADFVAPSVLENIEKLGLEFKQNVRHLFVRIIFPPRENQMFRPFSHPFIDNAALAEAHIFRDDRGALDTGSTPIMWHLTQLVWALNDFTGIGNLNITLETPASGNKPISLDELDHVLPFYDLESFNRWQVWYTHHWMTHPERVSAWPMEQLAGEWLKICLQRDMWHFEENATYIRRSQFAPPVVARAPAQGAPSSSGSAPRRGAPVGGEGPAGRDVLPPRGGGHHPRGPPVQRGGLGRRGGSARGGPRRGGGGGSGGGRRR